MTMTAATYTPPNLGNLTTTPERYHVCGPGGSETFALVVAPVSTTTSEGSVTDVSFKDLTLERRASAATRTDALIDIERLSSFNIPDKAVTVTSSNTSILQNPLNGTCQGVASGVATLVARAEDGEVSARDVTVSISASATVERWKAVQSGTLLAHCTDQIDSLVAGKTRASMDLWSTRNDTTGEYVWNANCWGSGIDNITCMSPWNSSTGRGGGGALITPRHFLVSHHLGYYPKVGATIRYVRPDNVTETFTVTDLLAHPYVASYIMGPQDIVICKLDRDVPESIKFAKVLPEDPSAYFPTIHPNELGSFPQYSISFSGARVWARSCHTTQNKRLATAFMILLPNVPTPQSYPGAFPPWQPGEYAPVRHVVGLTDFRLKSYPENPLGDEVIVGDSGAPAFLLINNELVLVNVWSQVGSGYGFYADATIVNGMLDTLGGGYQLTEVDLSEFPTY